MQSFFYWPQRKWIECHEFRGEVGGSLQSTIFQRWKCTSMNGKQQGKNGQRAPTNKADGKSRNLRSRNGVPCTQLWESLFKQKRNSISYVFDRAPAIWYLRKWTKKIMYHWIQEADAIRGTKNVTSSILLCWVGWGGFGVGVAVGGCGRVGFRTNKVVYSVRFFYQ